MIELMWKAGSKFLDDMGPGVAIALFAIFMSWVLSWPHGQGLAMDTADVEPEAMRYESAHTTDSRGAAELMHLEGDDLARYPSTLDMQRYYCLLIERLSSGQREQTAPVSVSRYATLCDIFTDAARRVDVYADRLDGQGGFHPEPHGFMLHRQGTVQAVGPFHAQGECSEIAARLALIGEQPSRCKPYAEIRQASLLRERG
ncbi:hypothetical protein HOP62_07390 [Halomonas sp. MCCC 1A17488]|uniref:Uncharacterized protein n=1 Tax=Billgrantia sulfidoxydans TaxID=2733484 RepID=A0ABX7W3V9_9GAMM|nr:MULTISPECIES: hypothetical protein [Halomonas]MCE8015896.1 hypothetical protein [Halomonas sp. MCCC 1A17488]MCG3239229.1 hypothetical protein [Halomonas sp. MCCC 1A17488]QPP50836.1 hypothetical protein I4484_07005 [Halomonas sp. SS10-MC5]QTP54362.1 hypothetical protein HNO51_06455 [Halomonas sulfidoxydans]